MDSLRYWIALLVVVLFPAGMSMWFVIHPWAAFWRRRGPIVTYSVVIVVVVGVATTLSRLRRELLAVEFGFSWVLSLAGLAFLISAIVLERSYREQIQVSTLLGLPEVSELRQDRLLTEGTYSRIRHPRYAGILLEMSAFALFANYLAGYVVVLASVPVTFLIVLLEERELLARFGDDYRQYMSRVPRFIPRPRRSQESRVP